jgi:DNA-binding response OmpR family regulator
MSSEQLKPFILAVDDEPLIVELVRDALEDGGFAVKSARSANDAIAILENNRARDYSALVTDVNLGKSVSGWDVARRGRELNPALPVIYISGDSSHEWEAHGVPESILLEKPFAPAQLVVAVATLVNAAKGD